jgi:hypothetical protein
MATDLTNECKEGYVAGISKCPYLHSSPSWLAWQAGQRLVGMSSIKRARMSRGYSVRVETVGGSTLIVSFGRHDLSAVTINRL